jgi:hypothetical protein
VTEQLQRDSPDALPRDGRRYEIVDGRLLVTGAQPPPAELTT